MLRERLVADSSVVTLSCGRLTSLESLYQTILFELGRPYRGMSENELRLDLINYLTDTAIGEHRLALLVDEAHTLSLKLLEEIRMMMNIATNSGEPHVRVLLVGSPLLEERFTHPKLEAFSQRITTRCYLELRQAETRQYIHAQIDAVGGDGPKLFTTKLQSNLAARSLAISINIFPPRAMLNCMRGAMSSISSPNLFNFRMYSTPVARAKASSSTALPPAL
jgi:type II secretory pathway predicted ATPase ExeA